MELGVVVSGVPAVTALYSATTAAPKARGRPEHVLCSKHRPCTLQNVEVNSLVSLTEDYFGILRKRIRNRKWGLALPVESWLSFSHSVVSHSLRPLGL